jgi:hypothetical protein
MNISDYEKKSCILARARKKCAKHMDYEIVKLNEKQFLAVTSLYPDEFDSLLTTFSSVCEKYFRYHTLEGKKRKIITSKEHSSATLKGSAQKLFFLLVFLKTNNLQEYQAISFGVSQTKVSRISKILLNLLNETLKKMNLVPFRDGELLQKGLAEHPTKIFAYDGLERSVQRNSCVQAQEQEFSGKKKHIK